MTGVKRLYAKHQGMNPTGSFKDAGMTVAATFARQAGYRWVACASTGNTSASMAAYAARGGMRSLVLVPEGKISWSKLSQALDYGALTCQLRTDFDGCLRLLQELVRRAPVYQLNSINPFRLEGQKTLALELLEQLDWQPPDHIIVPGGNLGNSSAIGKALLEMLDIGLIPRLPKLSVIQAEGANALVRTLREAGGKHLVSVQAETRATAIRIGNPASWEKAVKVLQATGGACEQVSELEIAQAKAEIGAEGIGCEPASAVTLAGLKKLLRQGFVKPEETVVLVLTGSLLKDPDFTMEFHRGESFSGHCGRARKRQAESVPPSSGRHGCHLGCRDQDFGASGEIRSNALECLRRKKRTSRRSAALHLALPATSANLGPAFDAAALAMDLYITIDARPAPSFSITATGRDQEICRSLENHLILSTYSEILQAHGAQVIPLSLRIKNDIPIGKGCGSSAAARLAGIALANHFGHLRWTDAQIIGEASRREHHPDNASACWMGGLTIARMSGDAEAQVVCIRPKGKWPLLLAIPDQAFHRRSSPRAARAVFSGRCRGEHPELDAAACCLHPRPSRLARRCARRPHPSALPRPTLPSAAVSAGIDWETRRSRSSPQWRRSIGHRFPRSPLRRSARPENPSPPTSPAADSAPSCSLLPSPHAAPAADRPSLPDKHRSATKVLFTATSNPGYV